MSELDKLEKYLKEHGYEYTREDVDKKPVGTVIAWMPLPEPYKGGEQE